MGRATTGTFTSNGAAKFLELGFDPDFIRIRNFTTSVSSEWFKGMAANSAIGIDEAGAVTNINADGFLSRDGWSDLNNSRTTLLAPNSVDPYYKSPGQTPAAAAGQITYNVNDPVAINNNGRGIYIGTAVGGANNDVLYYEVISND